ncbi:M48 family metalloprotease [Vermiphilus pyriformis]|uniref:Peptidase M48 domain-containing protein n=1 Tax=candidate division TM6 bacterium JCVI TM6SC1 TaxID=1306947 RepID=A0A0D2JEP0_9BACT|nr:hypothetical protein J120_00955 [candidate division TM6 bacterium JCVI TM6SC1]UNE35817.1 MAG: M48 family metalloprotease [Vermiphilus pyriformis]
MKIYNNWCFISLFILASMPNSTCNPLNKIIGHFYDAIFGANDASPYYRNLIQSALKDFNVPNVQNIAIRRMDYNSVNPYRYHAYAFTLNGIWIDETMLDKLKPCQQQYLACHEAAHFYAGHYQQLIRRFTGVAILLGVINPLVIKLLYPSITAAIHACSATTSALIGAWLITMYSTRSWFVHKEVEADMLAAHKLIALGKKAVLEEYVQLAEQALQSATPHCDAWRPTILQHINALRRVITAHSKVQV